MHDIHILYMYIYMQGPFGHMRHHSRPTSSRSSARSVPVNRERAAKIKHTGMCNNNYHNHIAFSKYIFPIVK